MNKYILVAAGVLFSSAAFANERVMIIGDESSIYQPSNEDFDRMSKAIEYYEAKKKLIKAQKEIQDLTLEASGGQAAGRSTGGASSGAVPRHLRGMAAGDVFVDERGNAVAAQKRPTAFVAAVSGMGGALSAELVWGDIRKVVKRGDSVIGGSWVVESVNHDDIVIANGGKRLRISSIPVDIQDLMDSM